MFLLCCMYFMYVFVAFIWREIEFEERKATAIFVLQTRRAKLSRHDSESDPALQVPTSKLFCGPKFCGNVTVVILTCDLFVVFSVHYAVNGRQHYEYSRDVVHTMWFVLF